MFRILFYSVMAMALTNPVFPIESPEGTSDQVQIGHFESEPWEVLPGGHFGNYRVAYPSGKKVPVKSSSWQISVPKPNSYHIQTTWTADPSNARNARFIIYDGKRPLKAVTVNQQRPPQGETVGKSVFQELGVFKITGKSIQVDLTNEADGRVVADTIRVK